MKEYFAAFLFLTSGAYVYAQDANTASALTEKDFLGDVPIVLSVSRLAQRLDDAPAAMTILDRDFIRRSGARNVVELLRFVPGFATNDSYETDAPMAYYHGRNNDWSNRLQVLVDGRSVYSGFQEGSVGVGLQTLALEDIERIEVVRGSDSAAYGARAMLGVVNIISRDVHDTPGLVISGQAGTDMVSDGLIRYGWGDSSAMYRITVDSTSDNGLEKMATKNQLGIPSGNSSQNQEGRINFSAYRSLGSEGEINMRAGAAAIGAYRGDLFSPGNFQRFRYMDSSFLQLDWHKPISENEDVAVSLSHTLFGSKDSYPFLEPAFKGTSYYGAPVGGNGWERNDAFSVQDTYRLNSNLRVVWGGELRQEYIESQDLFDARNSVVINYTRFFGNMEWHLTPMWVVNAGGLLESSTIGGENFAPRLMLNWHMTPEQTFRIGASTAFRTPAAFEKYGQVTYYPLPGFPPPYLPPVTTQIPNTQVQSENMFVKEIGYNLNLPKRGLTADVRLFDEYITNGLAPTMTYPTTPGMFVNSEFYSLRGAEYQIAWTPEPHIKLFFGQSLVDTQIYASLNPEVVQYEAPHLANFISLMYSFGNGWHMTLSHTESNVVTLMSSDGETTSAFRTDARLAREFKIGKSNAELALTIQNFDTPYQDGDLKFMFQQRVFISLRIEN